MKKIFCHPDNLVAMTRAIDSRSLGGPGHRLDSFGIFVDPDLPRDVPTGRYKLPDGRVTERDNVCVVTRFVEYGPEDLDWMVYVGLITEEREAYCLVVDDTRFKVRYGMIPSYGMRIPSSMIKSGC